MRGREGYEGCLQAQHGVADPLLSFGVESWLGGREKFTVFQSVAERVARGTAVVFAFQAVGVEIAGVAYRAVAVVYRGWSRRWR